MSFVYMLRCADGTLYSGWTSDLTRRLAAHAHGKAGAKYTRARRPVTLVHCEVFGTQSEAMRRENEMKALTRAQKETLVAQTATSGDELLEVLDAQNAPCGALPRALVHRCGLRHRVAHLLVCQTVDGAPGVWLQQRGYDRPTLPGCYDWTATGHLAAGEPPLTGILREAREEAGLSLTADRLILAAETACKVQHSDTNLENEILTTFLCFAEHMPAFSPGEEVVRMAWASLKSIEAAYRDGAPLPLRLVGGAEETAPAALLAPLRTEWNKIKALCKAGCKDTMQRRTAAK